MEYEFDNKSSERREFPNPLKVENLFLMATAAMVFAIALVLLWVARGQTRDPTQFLNGTTTGFILLLFSISLLSFALTHLKFFFGHSEPRHLSSMARLREILSARVLGNPEPFGPLNGLLYAWVDKLIDAPLCIQRLAQLQFRNAATMVALLVSLVLTDTVGRVGVSDESWAAISSWLGTVYLGLVVYLLTWGSPWRLDRQHVVTSRGSLAFLITFALVGPISIPIMSDHPAPQTWVNVFPGIYVVLIASIGIYWLFFHALMGELPGRLSREVSAVQQVWNLRCLPAQVMRELDRTLSQGFGKRVGGWRYVWKEPEVDLTAPAGSFLGESITETQPLPIPKESPEFLSAWIDPSRRRIVLLDIGGAVLTIIGALLLAAHGTSGWGSAQSNTPWVYGSLFMVLGSFSFMAGHRIWSRFDFESVVLWITMDGHYTSGSLKHGTRRDTIETRSQLAQIESMTFRLWAARLHTVTYGRHSQRYVVQMTGESDLANKLAQRLYTFAQSQAVLVAPTSEADLERHAQLSQMNRLRHNGRVGGSRPAELAVERQEAAPFEASARDSSAAGLLCTACNQSRDLRDTFCRHCGARQVANAAPTT